MRARDLGAVLQDHAGRASPARVDPCHGRVRADLGAGGGRGARHRLRDRPHAAHHVAVEALHLVVAAREHVEHQPDRGARPVRRRVHAVHVRGQVHAADLLGLVVAFHEIAQRTRREPDQVADLVAGHRPEPLERLAALAHPLPPLGVQVRRFLQEVGLQVAGQLLQTPVDDVELLGVGGRDLRELGDRPVVIGPPRHHRAVLERALHARLARHHLQAVLAQVEVADHLGAQHRGDVGRGGGAEPRRDLLGDAGAAHHVAAFQHQGLQPRPREVERRGEAVVAAADHDHVVARGGGVALGRHAGAPWSAAACGGVNVRSASVVTPQVTAPARAVT